MRVYFSLDYLGGNAYLGMDEQPVMMDTVVTDLNQLLNLLELHLGLHTSHPSDYERLVSYYKCVRDYMKAHERDTDNQLYGSYTVSPLATAREMLKWRDALAVCGWTHDTPAGSRRMKVLQGVEQIFAKQGDVDLSKRLCAIMARLKEKRGMMKDISFIIPFPYEWLHPMLQRLFTLAVADGANVERIATPEIAGDNNLARLKRMMTSDDAQPISFNFDDDSVRIWHFKDEMTAGEWLAALDDATFDVIVQSDTKLTDNFLHMMGKNVTGSAVSNSTPQIIQLFFTGITIHARPLNIEMLLQWLYSPMHPLPAKLRYRLAERLTSTGGWNSKETDERNANCYQLVNGWIDGKEEAEKGEPIDRKEVEKRMFQALVFLPDFEGGNDNTLKVENLHAFLRELGGWARQSSISLVQENSSDTRIMQLNRLVELCDTLKGLTDDLAPQDTIAYSEIEKHLSCLYEPTEFVQYQAQMTSRQTVKKPGQIAAKADRVLWAGLYNFEPMMPATHFLTPTETEQLKDYIQLWDADDVRMVQQQTMLLPLLFCQKQISLVTVEHVDDKEGVNKHPLMVRIEKQVANHQEFTESPAFKDNDYQPIAPLTNNAACGINGPYTQIQRSDLIQWRKHESPTSIEQLIQNPLDYALENIAYIRDNGQSDLANLARTKGNVAHGVIQSLFYVPDDTKSGYADAIKKRVELSYKTAFDSVVETKGAILLLLENAIERRQLFDQLKECIVHLIDIIEKNKLHVVACEMPLNGNTLGTPDDVTPQMHGYADMVLADENGKHVIFDFKWTTSRHYYQGLLEKNHSSQLAIYAELLSELTEEKTMPTAYFLMPVGRLYSTVEFKSYYATKIDVEAGCEGDIISQILASYRYRRDEIMSGKIEMGEGWPLEELDYYNDTESHCLLPLKPDYYDENVKAVNNFSSYQQLKS